MNKKLELLSRLNIMLWGEQIGKLAIDENGIGHFRYDPNFVTRGIEPSPLAMPVHSNRVYHFRNLNKETFKGFPGLIADSLPDSFGDGLLEMEFKKLGIKHLSNIELLKLCYINKKGMGALEFEPSFAFGEQKTTTLKLQSLVDTIDTIISSKNFQSEGSLNNINDLISVGSSLGGAAPKAVLGINFDNNSICAGNMPLSEGYKNYIIKFDGKKNKGLIDTEEPMGIGKVEYVYSQMAKISGIKMSPCRLLEDGNRAHFLTERFDRNGNEKIHMQTLHAMAHMDSYKSHDYNMYFKVLTALKLPYEDHEQLFKRIVFNVIGGNTDTHTKNTSFLMDREGKWRISPAYDLLCSVSLNKGATINHTTYINGKNNDITRKDLKELANRNGIKQPEKHINTVLEGLSKWQELAKETQVKPNFIKHVQDVLNENYKNLSKQNGVSM